MLNKLDYIIGLGTNPNQTDQQFFVTRFINTVSILLLISVLFGFIRAYYFWQNNISPEVTYISLAFCIFGISSSFLCLYLTKNHNIKWAKHTLLFTAVLLVSLANFIFENQTGTFVYFLFIPILIFFFYGIGNTAKWLILLSAIMILLTQLYQFYVGAYIETPKPLMNTLIINNVVISFGLIVAIVYFQVKTHIHVIAELNTLSSTDTLTGLANRHAFNLFLKNAWSNSKREQLPLATIICDIDFFKQYNDYYGHPMGDKCLIQVASCLKKLIIRDTDFIARIGGEEFVILLNNTSKEHAINFANSICENINQLKIPHQKSTISKNLTISCGLYWKAPNDKCNKEEIIEKADKALYQAKYKGRNQIVISD